MGLKQITPSKQTIPKTQHTIPVHNRNASIFQIVVVSLLGGTALLVILSTLLRNSVDQYNNPQEPEYRNVATIQSPPSVVSHGTPPLPSPGVLDETTPDPPPVQHEEQSEEETQSLTAQFYEHFGLHPDDSSLQIGYFEHEDALDVFIERHTTELDLPNITTSDIILSSQSGKEGIISYIARMSAENNENLHNIEMLDIDRGFSSFAATNNPSALIEVAVKLNHNASILKAIPVPQEAASLHTLYVSAYMILAKHTEELLYYNNDPVRAVTSATVIAQLEPIFDEIEVRLMELLKDISQYPI